MAGKERNAPFVLNVLRLHLKAKLSRLMYPFICLAFCVSFCFQSQINFIAFALITYLEDVCPCVFYIQHTDKHFSVDLWIILAHVFLEDLKTDQ